MRYDFHKNAVSRSNGNRQTAVLAISRSYRASTRWHFCKPAIIFFYDIEEPMKLSIGVTHVKCGWPLCCVNSQILVTFAVISRQALNFCLPEYYFRF